MIKVDRGGFNGVFVFLLFRVKIANASPIVNTVFTRDGLCDGQESVGQRRLSDSSMSANNIVSNGPHISIRHRDSSSFLNNEMACKVPRAVLVGLPITGSLRNRLCELSTTIQFFSLKSTLSITVDY